MIKKRLLFFLGQWKWTLFDWPTLQRWISAKWEQWDFLVIPALLWVRDLKLIMTLVWNGVVVKIWVVFNLKRNDCVSDKNPSAVNEEPGNSLTSRNHFEALGSSLGYRGVVSMQGVLSWNVFSAVMKNKYYGCHGYWILNDSLGVNMQNEDVFWLQEMRRNWVSVNK